MLTAINKDVDRRIIEEIKSKNPGGKLLEVDDVAAVVQTLLTSALDYNGKNIVINSAEDVI